MTESERAAFEVARRTVGRMGLALVSPVPSSRAYCPECDRTFALFGSHNACNCGSEAWVAWPLPGAVARSQEMMKKMKED